MAVRHLCYAKMFNCCQGFSVKVSKNWSFHLNKTGINKILEKNSIFLKTVGFYKGQCWGFQRLDIHRPKLGILHLALREL